MKKSVALVLSSGGARGIAHIGVINGLLEAGYHIHSISGSSMGAVVGGVYAAGKLKEFTEWVCNFDKLDVIKLMDFTLSTQGFVRGERVFNEMRKFVGDINIQDLNIPFSVIATDVVNRREVVFREGNLFDALRASAAVPSVLMPAMVDGVELVDGGVLNPLPIEYVNRDKDDILVLSDVNANVPCALMPPKKNDTKRFAVFVEKWNEIFPKSEKNKPVRLSYFELITRSVDLMQDRITDLIIKNSGADIVVKISRHTCGTFSFYRSKELVEYGYSEFNKSLKIH